MRSLLALALMMVATVVGCAPPTIGSYPDDNDREAPNRSDSDDEEDEDEATPEKKGSTTSSTTQPKPPVTPTTPSVAGSTVAVAATGSGQGDITCNGGACSGTYPNGSVVTLSATPKAGSIFVGWTGGGCTGTLNCNYTVTADGKAPSAQFETLAGNWVGTYTNNRPNGNCQFKNAGNITQTIAGSVGAFTTAASAINGLEIRNLNGCGLVDSRSGSSTPSAATVNGTTVTGNWNVQIQGINGTLPLPFTATITGNKMVGTWTCANCTGGFDVTKQ